MASIRKRSKKPGSPWYVIYNDANGKQKWLRGYSDKAQTQQLANRLENEKTAVRRGDVDPQAEQRKVERARPVTAHVEGYRTALESRGCNANHVSYTIRGIEVGLAHAGVSH